MARRQTFATFSSFCQAHNVTDEEREQLFTFLMAYRLRRILRG